MSRKNYGDALMPEKITLETLRHYKQSRRPITMLTCYDYAAAVLLQNAGADCLLVGDSLAQLVLGHENTLSVTMDTMITLTAAVRKGAPDVCLVGDMPYTGYHPDQEPIYRNCRRFLDEAGCDLIKIEVNRSHLDTVAQLAAQGIPVMTHLGYTPQTEFQLAKKIRTRLSDQALQLLQTAQDFESAGAAALLLECVTDIVAQRVTAQSALPVISCGSGPYCDGQVMVLHEILALPGSVAPRFAKAYGQVAEHISTAAKEYLYEVRHRLFPTDEHCYHMPPEEKEKLDAASPPPQT